MLKTRKKVYAFACDFVLFLQMSNRFFLIHFFFIQHLTVWGVEPVVTHQTSWLESTGICGVQQNQAGGNSARKRA